MASAEVASRPPERPMKRKPFANFIRKLGIKGGDQQEKNNSSKKPNGGGIALKSRKNTIGKNNPYPESGHLRNQQQSSQPSFGDSSRHQYSSSFSSLPPSAGQDREGHSHSNKSGAPTLATNPETIHSDAGNSRAATTTTGAGALSSMDGAGANSTFSSPNQSDHSLATTLTTIQSTSNPQGGTNGVSGHNQTHSHQSQPLGSNFSHQYPVSPAHSASMASAIPRHLQGENQPNTYNSATANNLLTDNASILTLASSSKRRRRSMDTDASVRALAPSSVWGGSRESLPLSVLSGTVGSSGEAAPRHSVTGAAAERASVYSSSGLARDNFTSSALASERNSYYAKPAQASDAKSLRSISNLKKDEDKVSITGIYARSDYGDTKSLNAVEVASLRSVGNTEGHARNGSIGGSIGSPVNTPSLLRQTSIGGTALSISRRSSDWKELDGDNTTEVDLNGAEEEIRDGKKE